MRVTIDHDRCAIAGECVFSHPALFAFGDDDQPIVLDAAPASPAAQLAARQAAAVCPSGAIAVED